MKKARILAGALAVVFSVVQANAQLPNPLLLNPLHYDPYYSIARDIGAKSVNLGLNNSDLAKVGDESDVFLMAKYTFSGRFEAGGRATFGFLHEGADDFQSVVVGVKDIINEYSAASFNVLLPVGAVDKPGLSLGYMRTLVSDKLKVNTHVQLGFLEGYTFSSKAKDIVITALIQPTRSFGSKATGYADLLLDTSTHGKIADNFGINVRPHVDFQIAKGNMLNVGVSIGVAGDNKQKELGLRVAYKVTMK